MESLKIATAIFFCLLFIIIFFGLTKAKRMSYTKAIELLPEFKFEIKRIPIYFPQKVGESKRVKGYITNLFIAHINGRWIEYQFEKELTEHEKLKAIQDFDTLWHLSEEQKELEEDWNNSPVPRPKRTAAEIMETDGPLQPSKPREEYQALRPTNPTPPVNGEVELEFE